MAVEVTLKPTTQMTTIDGARVRVWEGSYKGHRVVAFIASIGVEDGAVNADFARELVETAAPPGIRIIGPSAD